LGSRFKRLLVVTCVAVATCAVSYTVPVFESVTVPPELKIPPPWGAWFPVTWLLRSVTAPPTRGIGPGNGTPLVPQASRLSSFTSTAAYLVCEWESLASSAARSTICSATWLS